MFWDTQVTSDLNNTARSALGPDGRFLVSPTHFNVSLYTHEAGKFWYGDLHDTDDFAALKTIAEDAKTTVYVLPDLGVEIDTPLIQQALMEVAV